MNKALIIIFLFLIVSCDNKKRDDSQSEANMEGEVITRFDENEELMIKHTFPDTLVVGDTLQADIYSDSDNWKVIDAYSYCRIGSDGVFRIFHRTRLECLRFLVENNRVKVWFITLGAGPKKFDLVTLIIENNDGVKKAFELQLTYYLKESNGS